MKKLFTDHPESINETYVEHLQFAGMFGFRMILAGLASLVHAVFPFLFEKTASQMISKMYQRMNNRVCDDHGTS
jgi:hypothetical protein